MTFKEEIELYKETPKLDVQRVKKVFFDLMNDIIHPAPCCCVSCLYHLYIKRYKGKGRKFDKESFFLEDLAYEIRRSKIEQTYIIVMSEECFSSSIRKFVLKDDDNPTKIVGYSHLGQSLKVRNVHKDVSNFIKKEFSDINPNPQRIKSKVYRLLISGVLARLEQERNLEWIKSEPGYAKKKMQGRKIKRPERFIQDVADFIYSQPNKKVTQRILQRKFRKEKEDLESIKYILKWNYCIQIQEKAGYRAKQTFYRGTMKSSKGRYWKVGI